MRQTHRFGNGGIEDGENIQDNRWRNVSGNASRDSHLEFHDRLRPKANFNCHFFDGQPSLENDIANAAILMYLSFSVVSLMLNGLQQQQQLGLWHHLFQSSVSVRINVLGSCRFSLLITLFRDARTAIMKDSFRLIA
jgi:hypothetical protein